MKTTLPRAHRASARMGVVVADERSVSELGRLVDRHDIELRDMREKYVTRELFLAMLGAVTDRVLNLEKDKASRRNLLLGIAGTLVGVAASALITYTIAKGGGGH